MKLGTQSQCASPSLVIAPLFGLTVMFHCGTSLLLQAVVEVVVGEVIALDLAEESCEASSQSSEMSTTMNQMLLSIQYSLRRVIRFFRTLFSCVAVIIQGHPRRVRRMRCTWAWLPSCWRPCPPNPPPMRASVCSVSVAATPGSTPNSSSSECELLALSRTASSFASTSARSRGGRGGHRFLMGLIGLLHRPRAECEIHVALGRSTFETHDFPISRDSNCTR